MLSDDDQKLWQALTRDVVPLNRPADAVAPMVVQPAPVALRSRPLRDPRPFVLEELPQVNIPGVDKKVSVEIRRGKIPTDARIDLHGMTIDQAHQEVIAFLLSCQHSGKRKVLVITGKGGESSIRREFPHWMHQPPLHHAVLSCTHAHQRQGGSGAFVIILRKL